MDTPSQIHIAIGGKNSNGMWISWMTEKQGETIVQYGYEKMKYNFEIKNTMKSMQYTYCNYTSLYQHHVLLPILIPNTTYYYIVGNDHDGWSKEYEFKTPPKRGNKNVSISLGILGDMGQTNYSKDILNRIRSYDTLDAVLLAGDLSYADTIQSRWDSWGQLVEPSTATIPWMMAAGNHEIELSCTSNTFDAYQARFRMPFSESGGSHGNLYYSFDIGNVHVIVLTPYIPTYYGSDQYTWLERDFEGINRDITPWIVVMMHGPWYSSNRAHQSKHEPQHSMRDEMETLLFKNRVNIVLAGHVHSYERTHPVYHNNLTRNGPIYITIGDAGNREGLATKYIHPKPIWSAYRKARYGYGLLHVKNHSHALFEWHESDNSKLCDSIWIELSL